MRAIIMAAGLALAATPALAADPVEGDWLIQSGRAKITIAPCVGRPDQMCGAISWLKQPLGQDGQPRRDTANPNPQLRQQPLLGSTMLSGFHRAEPGRWTGGRIYDANDGKSYNSKMRVAPDGTLKVEGCILVICQAQTWRRSP